MRTTYKLDMTMMLTFHDALRRDLDRIGQMTARSEGWDRFERFLRKHHEVEDESLWPALRKVVADDADLALLDDMQAEHDELGPLLDAVDAGLDRGEAASRARADLDASVRNHLRHEEDECLPLVDRTLDVDQWMAFGQAAIEKFGPDMQTLWPWLLEDVEAPRAAEVLQLLPEPARDAYRTEWQPAYAAEAWWAP
jgi:hemerythrin-like domain-containing protein